MLGATDAGYEPGRSPFVKSPRAPAIDRVLPVVNTVRSQPRARRVRDAVAGVTVAALAIPAALGYAQVAGVPAVHGLYLLVFPVLAYTLLGSSRRLVVGPEGTMATICGSAVIPIAAGDPDRAVALASMLAILVGICFALAAVVRLGWLADYLSIAVLTGYMHGVLFALIVRQLGPLCGVTITAGHPMQQLRQVFSSVSDWSGTTLIVGLLTVVVLVVLRRLSKAFPAPLAVLVLAIVVSAAVDLSSHGVATMGSIPSGLPHFGLPHGVSSEIPRLIGPAIGIFLVSFADALLTARSFEGKHGDSIRPGNEIRGMGAVDILAGLTQGFPAGASGSRTAVNDQMQARSQLSGAVSVLVVVVVLLFLTGPLEYLPKSALAGIIIVAASGIFSLPAWRLLAVSGKRELAIGLVASAGVVLIGVLPGILLAAALSLIDFVSRAARPSDAVLGYVPELERFGNIKRHPRAFVVPGLVIYRLESPLFFANADWFAGRVLEAIRGAPAHVRWFVLDASAVSGIDASGAAVVRKLVERLAGEGTGFAIARIYSKMEERFERLGLLDVIGRANVFPTVNVAVRELKDRPGPRVAGSHD